MFAIRLSVIARRWIFVDVVKESRTILRESSVHIICETVCWSGREARRYICRNVLKADMVSSSSGDEESLIRDIKVLAALV